MLRLDTIRVTRLSLLSGVILALLVLGACRRSPEAKEARFLASGKAFMQAKDYPRAKLQFQNAIQAVPKDPEPYYQLAQANLASGDLRSALGLLNKAIDLNAKHRASQLLLAELLMTLSRDKKTLEGVEQRIETTFGASPDNADALSTLALTEFKLGKPEEAQKHLETALEKFPDSLRASVAMARLKLASKDLNGAEQVLKTAVQKAPNQANPLVALGSLYLIARKWTDAEQQLLRASQLDPKNATALLGLAVAQIRSGRNDKAEQTYARISAFPDVQYKPLHAMFLYQQGKRDAAIAEFAKLAKDNPKDRQARTRLVAAYMNTSRAADAEKVLTEALKQNGKDVEALVQRAEVYLVSNKYTEAQADLQQALRYSPDSGLAHYFLARVHQARGETLLQRQELGEALRLNKFLLPARLELAQALLRVHDGKAALSLMNEREIPPNQRGYLGVTETRNYALLEIFKETHAQGDLEEARKGVDRGLALVKAPDLLLQDAFIKSAKKDYAGARASLETALQVNPEEVRALEALAWIYVAQKQAPMATRKVREHVAAHPKSVRLQKFLGDWLFSFGDHNEARQAYTAAKQLDPKLTSVDIAMARLDLADNKPDDARKILTRLVQTTENVESYFWLAMMEEKSGNFDGAVSYYRKVIEADPHHLMALNNLSFLLADHGKQLDEALKLAQQVKELAPNDSSVADTLGWAFYQKGIYGSAVKQLEEAVSKGPTALHKYHLAMAYFRSGDPKHGDETLQSALKLNPDLPEAKLARQLQVEARQRN